MRDDDKGSDKKVRYDLERRRVAFPATMIALLVLIAVGNEAINSRKGDDSESQKRNMAAARRWLGDSPETRQWEKRLARNLVNKDERDVASFGNSPNAFDELRYGFFEGKYSTHMIDGKLRQISFIENSSDRPRYIEDPKKFLENQKSLLGIPFENILEQDDRKPSGAFSVQRFLLKSSDGLTLGTVDFTTDEFGRFRDLKIITSDSKIQ